MKKNTFNSWETSLVDNINSMKETIILVSPYMKFKVIKQIISFLPTDKKINFILISSFNNEVFLNKKSDLDMYDYLINADTENIIFSCYKLNNIHEPINIIDIDYKEIALSHTSFTLKNKNIQLSDQNQIITPSNIKNMEDVLNKEAYISFTEFNALDTFIQEDAGGIEDSILDTQQEELFPIDQVNYNNIIERINKFKGNKDDIKSFSNKIITFKTISLAISNISPEDYKNAEEDLEKLEKHIKQVFTNIMPLQNNITLYDDLLNCFIHNTWNRRWKIRTPYSKERKTFMMNLGKASFDFIISQQVVKSNFSVDRNNEYYADKLKYIKAHYPHKKAFQSIQCNVFLYYGDIKNNFIEEIFYEFLGVIYWHLGNIFLQNIFLRYLNHIDTLRSDDYKSFDAKTVLQEVTQAHNGKIPEYVNVGRVGPEHNPTFTFNIKYNGDIIGIGEGKGKKDAQNNAAKKALITLFSKFKHLKQITNKKTSHRKILPYKLPKERATQLIQLNKSLKKPISNLKLLDIAFTHISYTKNHPYSRANNSLSFLGNYIEDLCRKQNIMHQLNILDSTALQTLKNIQQNLEVGKILVKYSKKLHLHKYLNTTLSSTNLPASVQTDVVQSFIALYFLEYGMKETQLLVEAIWNDVNLTQKKLNTTSLQEYLQDSKFGLQGEDIKFILLSESGLDNKKMFEIGCTIKNKLYGKGKAGSKKEARRTASKNTFANNEFKKDFPA